jgi:aryl-alcohol dehydrogenase-like predicted oxidoreductase
MPDMAVVLGTMTIGGQADAAASAGMLAAFAAALLPSYHERLEVDTARMYQMPNRATDLTADDDVDRSTEAILGALLGALPAAITTRVHLATKANPWAEWGESLNAAGVRRQLETSLAALGRPTVGIFYLHPTQPASLQM